MAEPLPPNHVRLLSFERAFVRNRANEEISLSTLCVCRHPSRMPALARIFLIRLVGNRAGLSEQRGFAFFMRRCGYNLTGGASI